MKWWSRVASPPISYRSFIHAFQICLEGLINEFSVQPYFWIFLTVKRCNKAGFLLSLTSKMKVIGKSSLILRSPYMGKLKSTCWSPPLLTVEVHLFFHVFPLCFPQKIWDHWQHVAATRVAAIRQDSAVAFCTSGEPNSEDFGSMLLVFSIHPLTIWFWLT